MNICVYCKNCEQFFEYNGEERCEYCGSENCIPVVGENFVISKTIQEVDNQEVKSYIIINDKLTNMNMEQEYEPIYDFLNNKYSHQSPYSFALTGKMNIEKFFYIQYKKEGK